MNDANRTPTNDGESPVVSFLHAKGRTLGTPVSVTFELTSRCNFNCKMCYIHDSAQTASGELSAAQWLSLGEQALNAGTLFVLLTGGEPLVRNDFAEIYGGLKKMGFVVSVNTNGSLLTGETAKLFEKDPPHRLNISLYGTNNDTYRAVTGNGSFDSVKKNILNMRSVGVDCRLNCSLTPMNRDDLESIYSFAKENNLFIKGTSYMYPPVRRGAPMTDDGFRFTPTQTAFYRKEINRLTLPDEVFKKRRENLIARKDEIMNGSAPLPQNDDGQTLDCGEETDAGAPLKCRAGSSACWIDKNGMMSACGLFTVNKFDTLTNDFDGAWKKVRETTVQIKLSLKCAKCGKQSLCGVCAAAAAAETGRFDGTPTYLCEVADKLFDFLTEEN